MDENELPPAEAARKRRRDRDAEAQSRAGMRTGLAKQFKQVLDVQRRRADEVEPGETARPEKPAPQSGTPQARPRTRKTERGRP
jgi:hypothetical protein